MLLLGLEMLCGNLAVEGLMVDAFSDEMAMARASLGPGSLLVLTRTPRKASVVLDHILLYSPPLAMIRSCFGRELKPDDVRDFQTIDFVFVTALQTSPISELLFQGIKILQTSTHDSPFDLRTSVIDSPLAKTCRLNTTYVDGPRPRSSLDIDKILQYNYLALWDLQNIRPSSSPLSTLRKIPAQAEQSQSLTCGHAGRTAHLAKVRGHI